MKKLFLWAVLVTAAMPSMAQKVKYSVSGTYANNGEKIYLIDKLKDAAIDSVVVSGGKFSFNGTAEKDAFMGVCAEQKEWTTIFFNDGTPVVVNVNDSTLKGSPLNERLTKYDIEQDIPSRAFRARFPSCPRLRLRLKPRSSWLK